MFITIPLVVGIMFTLPRARHEASAALRQQTTRGKVTSYQRYDHNQCSYTFLVLGKQYSGRDSAPKVDIAIGERVLVYYDGKNPAFNSLEDFSRRTGRDQGFAVMCLCLIGIFAVTVLLAKAHHRTGLPTR